MTGAETLDIARDGLITMLVIAAPCMLVSLVVGLTVSLFQALTQIQEITLTFVPKMIALKVTLILFLPWMGYRIGSLMERLSQHIASG